jgi:hypothetical protein
MENYDKCYEQTYQITVENAKHKHDTWRSKYRFKHISPSFKRYNLFKVIFLQLPHHNTKWFKCRSLINSATGVLTSGNESFWSNFDDPTAVTPNDTITSLIQKTCFSFRKKKLQVLMMNLRWINLQIMKFTYNFKVSNTGSTLLTLPRQPLFMVYCGPLV